MEKFEAGKPTYRETFLSIVLDESGSMDTIKDQTIGGLNEYLDSLEKDKGQLLKVTLTKFNTNEIKVMYAGVEISKAARLDYKNYIPSACTPLFDALAQTINETVKANVNKCPVLCVVITDGLENSSKQYKFTDIADMIKNKEQEGWTFIYLGANQDSWVATKDLGYHISNVQDYDTKNVRAMYTNLAHSTHDYRAQGSSVTSCFFSDSKTGDEPPKVE